MRIAIFHELPVKSGSRKSVNEIAKRLKKNHRVDLYFVDRFSNPKEKKNFHKVYHYNFIPKIWKGKNFRVRLYRDSIELLKLYWLHKKIAKEIRSKNYDVVFIHASRFTESPFLLRFPLKNKVYYAHAANYSLVFEKHVGLPKNLDPIRLYYEKINRIIRKIIDIKNVRSADFLIANSKYTKKQLKKIYKKESVISYLGVDTNIFKTKNRKKEFDVLFIGSRQPVDGFTLLEKALRLIKPDITLQSIMIEGKWLDDRELAEFYNKAKLVVCLAFDEPFGLVAIESMSCSTPVIAVDEGGYRETIIDKKNGILIKRDSKALADAIVYLLSNDDIRNSYGRNAREKVVASWTWEKSVENLEEIFRKIV